MSARLVDGLARYSLKDLRQEPWRNGQGTTRTLAQREQDGKPLWRISVADITGDAPFSQFDGLDRKAVLVHGHGVKLWCDRGAWVMNSIGDVASFPGELPVHTEIACSLARFWNVMADRSKVRIDQRVSSSPHESISVDGDGALMVIAGEAEVLLGDRLSTTLRTGEGLLFDGCRSPVDLRFKDGSSHWLLSTLKKR